MRTSTGLLMILASAAGAAAGAAIMRGHGRAAQFLAVSVGFAIPWGLRAAFASEPLCSFLFVSDTHGPAATGRRVAARMLGEDGISFVAHGGDVADAPDLWQTWWDEPFRSVIARWPVDAASGNHDVETPANRAEFARRFGTLPRVVRCGDAADVYFMPWAFGQAEAEWLWAQVHASTARHRILIAHQPIWPVDGGNARQRDLVAPVLDRIDLVLSGHEHVYQDSRHAGTRQVIEVSGPKKYACPAGAAGCVENTTGYLRVDVSTGGIDVTRRVVP